MDGRCFCGYVRIRVSGSPYHETNCHCSICRRTSGAPFVTWFTVQHADFAFVSGNPATFRSSEHGTRTFCPRCGTPLTFESTLTPGEVDVTVCSLEEPERVPPRDHTQTATRLPWVELGALPAFPADRPR
jgi:hypothetical protein